MKWTGLNEIREKFLSFFESKEHLRLDSFSLIPKDDESLLLINSGMAPMKKYFTGEITPPRKRVTTCQKCIRTPDLSSVGITARHGTFFEMLGNFSFADYFKEEAIKWAWEFCTEVIKLPKEKIWVSVYIEDDETFNFWKDQIGVPVEKIVKLDKEDNFWEHGKGPCGPCSELYFDKGEKYSCGSKDCKAGCDCDRYMEFWNLVFSQFQNDGNGNYSELKQKNIDTGMGLERLACIMQGVDNIFLVDTVKNILDFICKLANKKYSENKKDDISIRIITDHIRSAMFMLADGIIPSNEGRGYVLRRLIRRAIVHGRLLGIKELFLGKVISCAIAQSENAYPYLKEKKEHILRVLEEEEKNFSSTLNRGLVILEDLIKNVKSNTLSGEDAFKLTDTYGLPLDIAKEVLNSKGIAIDLKKYNELLLNQKEMARNARKSNNIDAWKTENNINLNFEKTEFTGYEHLEEQAKLLGVVPIKDKDEVFLVFDKTPFYAQSGGQIGDAGEVVFGDFSNKILDTTKTKDGVFLHKVKSNSENFKIGNEFLLRVFKERREDIKRNHTGAHLLQSALKLILGEHVKQAGQLVTDEKIRFDFYHFKKLTDENLLKIEDLINEKILENIKVTTKIMSLEEAKKSGATALFTEKYGDVVRVLNIGDFSSELCGGTHISATSELCLFKILNESAVSSGVRRIEALTGRNAMNYFKVCEKSIRDSLKILGSKNNRDLVNICSKTVEDMNQKDQTIKELNSELVDLKVSKLLNCAKEHNGVPAIFKILKNCSSDIFKEILNKIKSSLKDFLVVLINKQKDKNTIAVLVSESLNSEGVFANKVLKKITDSVGGKGGGKKDFAMGTISSIKNLEKEGFDLKQFLM